jgi:cysteine synthase A
MFATDVLDSIGNTPIVSLRRVVPPASARFLVKLEFANPTGSMKDRMAKAVIEQAETDGRLQAGGTVVEYTSGTTGVSLAFVCAAKGYRFHAVFSDAFSHEKRVTMQAFGAQVTDVLSSNKMITEKLIKEMIETSRRLSLQPGHWWSDQLNNHAALTGYYSLGEEIWNQTDGKIDAFVQAVGSAHALHGVTKVLWRHNPKIHIVAVEPAESAVLSGHHTGSHKIEGIGIGFIPPLWDPGLVNEIMMVSTDEAQAMARRLAREEGLFAGTSSGANVVAASRLAQRLGPQATVVTLLVDSGLRYVSTELYRNE